MTASGTGGPGVMLGQLSSVILGPGVMLASRLPAVPQFPQGLDVKTEEGLEKVVPSLS